jgi:hypothetical protein
MGFERLTKAILAKVSTYCETRIRPRAKSKS